MAAPVNRRYNEDSRDDVVGFVPTSIPPWHMWGNTQFIDLVDRESAEIFTSTSQLIKIGHNRPDVWQWLFVARIVDAPTLLQGSNNYFATIKVLWDVTTGLGKSAVQLPAFDTFQWLWARDNFTVKPPFAAIQYATSTLSPPLDYTLEAGNVATPVQTTRRGISQILGQDLQVNVRAQLFVSGTFPEPNRAKIEVSAYMTPNCGAPDIKTR